MMSDKEPLFMQSGRYGLSSSADRTEWRLMYLEENGTWNEWLHTLDNEEIDGITKLMKLVEDIPDKVKCVPKKKKVQ